MRAGVTSKHHVILVQIGDKIKKKKTSTVHRPVLALKIRLLKEIKNFGKALIKVRNYTLFPEICKIYAN